MSLYQIREESGEYKREGVRKREEEGYNLCRYEANIYLFYLYDASQKGLFICT